VVLASKFNILMMALRSAEVDYAVINVGLGSHMGVVAEDNLHMFLEASSPGNLLFVLS
jgi:hypothetical protein